jgi:hypothetical protein
MNSRPAARSSRRFADTLPATHSELPLGSRSMLRVGRRALLATAILALAAAGGALLALRLSGPPPSDLRDIQFPYAVGEEEGMPVVEIFYATNRLPTEAAGCFGESPAPALSYGRARLRIPAGFRIEDDQPPDIPRGAIDEHRISVVSVEPLDEPVFFEAIQTRLTAGAAAANLVVQGIRNSFDSALRQAAALGRWSRSHAPCLSARARRRPARGSAHPCRRR